MKFLRQPEKYSYRNTIRNSKPWFYNYKKQYIIYRMNAGITFE